MPSGTVDITRYEVDIISNVGPNPARVRLYRPNGSLAVIMSFFEPDRIPRDNDAPLNFPATGFARVNYPISALAPVIDILRNEKPIYFQWITLERPYGYLTTSAEPVGEGEI